MSKIEFEEKDSCGVGFIASLKAIPEHYILERGLKALKTVEHRGALLADGISGDGSGIMTDIPWELFDIEAGSMAVATIFCPHNAESLRKALDVFEQTFAFLGLKVKAYRDVPIDINILGSEAKAVLPKIKHAFIERPEHCRTDESFDQLLYHAKQAMRTKLREAGIVRQFYFASLSSRTINYKGLIRAKDLANFYKDLQNPRFKTRFTLFHRRFSTNTLSSWDKTQPFRLIAHNGEINTIEGNRTWARSRERSLGLPMDELLTHVGNSDSGNFNEIVEALRYRSSIQDLADIMAIMIPSFHADSDYYKFWSRAMEPWDGPALVSYCNGHSIGARLDRNGFRPCHWAMSNDYFYLCSEAGCFSVNEASILKKGTIQAGNGVFVDLSFGEVSFADPSQYIRKWQVRFDPHLTRLDYLPPEEEVRCAEVTPYLFNMTKEEMDKILKPMVNEGKEPIGSMGDTAALALFSDQPRSFYDFFYQHFAQVTNPPIDYLREKMVTTLTTYLGERPNIFHPKELIPPPIGIEINSPVLSLGQLDFIRKINGDEGPISQIKVHEIETTYNSEHGVVGLRSRLEEINAQALDAIEKGVSIIILSDRKASFEKLPIPSLIVMRSVIRATHEAGVRLQCSLIVDSGDIRTPHQMSTVIGLGATGVCPYLSLTLAREGDGFDKKLSPLQRERNLIEAYEAGILKVMSKSGISVLRSYQSSKLFTIIGISKSLRDHYFVDIPTLLGGYELDDLVDIQLKNVKLAKKQWLKWPPWGLRD